MPIRTNMSIADGETLRDCYPQGLNWNTPIHRMTLVEMFDRATKFADRPAVDFLGTKLTYAELTDAVNKAAKGFQDMGVTKGDRIAFYMPNTQWHPILFFGAMKAGAVVVNLSPQLGPEELAHNIKDSGARIVVTSDLPKPQDTYGHTVKLLKKGAIDKVVAFNLADTLPKERSWLPSDMRRGLPMVKILNRLKNIFNICVRSKIVRADNLLAKGSDFTPVDISPDDTAVLQYTGGTTGLPKAAELTHANLSSNAQQIAAFFTDPEGAPEGKYTLKVGKSRMLAPLPFFHIFGLSTTMLAPVFLGIESIYILNPRDLETSLKIIERTKPDAGAAVPKLVEAAIYSKIREKYDYSSIRALVTGGSAMPAKVEQLVKENCDLQIYGGWGLTETSPVLTAEPPNDNKHNGTAGTPLPGVKIRVCDINEPEKIVPLGEKGELQAFGPNIMKGYWNNADETANVMTADGWFRTGDIGHIADDGFIYITDRLKRMINVGGSGKKAFPLAIENVISKFEGVAECAVVVVNKGTDKESAKAFVRAHHGKQIDEKNLRTFLAQHLAPYEVPKYIELVTEPLPQTTIGKPDWKKLETMEAEKSKLAAQNTTLQGPAPQP